MFVFPQLKQFKTFASTSCNSVEVIPRTSALAQTKNLKKKIFKSHLKENIQMEKEAVSKEPEM